MSTKKPFWQELTLHSVAPTLALLGVTISVRPDIIGEPNQCNKLVAASIDLGGTDDRAPPLDGTGDDRAPAPQSHDPIESTGSTEMPEEVATFDFSLPHFAIMIASLILVVQVIRLVHNWKNR